MTDLTIGRIHDDGFSRLRVLADHIRGTGLDAGSAADTAVNGLDGHAFFPLLPFMVARLFRLHLHCSQAS